ncbi:MAG: ATP-dependent DNA helicase RecG [Spirochaetales bacterium]|nr:ATP-dependent DNA helicase RecG [Spirochaetales bacterium]
MFIREINQEIRYLKGIGPKLSLLFEKLGINTIGELLLYFPRDYLDRTCLDTLKNGPSREKINVIVRIIAHDFIGYGRNKTLKVHVEDDTMRGALVCFGRNFLESVLVPGKSFLITGTFRYKFGDLQSSNFSYEPLEDETPEFSPILPVYALTAGLSQNILRRAIRAALNQFGPGIENEIPCSLMKKYRLMPKAEAVKTLHFPENGDSLKAARNALVYEEFFLLQLIMGRRMHLRRVTRRKRKKIGFILKQKLVKRLPFILTQDQKKAVSDIEQDLFSPYAMSRLLQGDVGCGKTLVAVLTSLAVIESGEQAAFMAPTELLAKQHADNIARLLEPLGVNIAYLSGSVKGAARSRLLSALKSGDIGIVVGTHALFSEDVAFKNLGYVIVDEQHKFGVMQRIMIQKKGESPDLLLMTATPIPRTLTLTAFGDLDTSVINMLPEGRKPVITHLTREGNEHRVYDRIRKELDSGHQVYFVYPLIEESAKSDLKDAIGMFEKLKKEVFKERKLGLIHSRVPEEEKKSIMENFRKKETDIIVATTVVEVGVDVPNANCMVIEHAERFGLSTLHQLRGRVGRGADQSYCFLIYGNNLTEDGIKRLKIMMETTDGFRIAEEDLKIRGPGEILGLKQSGFLKLLVADLIRDQAALSKARQDALAILEDDPGLIKPGNEVLREVLLRAPPFEEELADSG